MWNFSCTRWTLALLLVALLSPWAGAERPNLLWISCEDISPHVGCYGDPHATTPHIDRLAAQGVRYTHAFVTAGVCAPCRSSIISGMYQTTLGTHHMRCLARLPAHVKPFPWYLRQAGYYCSNNAKKDYQFEEPADTWDESSNQAHWRNRPRADQPFFSVFNLSQCHESGIADDDKYDRVTEGIARHDPQSLTTLPPYYPDTPAARADWARYYDVVSAMDREVGSILKQLDEDGLSDSTIVLFWSDHGVGLPRGKRWLYDSGMRVPLLVRVPRQWQELAPGEAGTTTDRLVSLMDLGPSMLRLAGIAPPEHVQGQAFLGSNQPPPREYVYGARDRMDERYDIIRAVRDHRFKYLRNYEPYKTYYQYMNTPERGRLMQEIRRVAAANELPPAARRYVGPSKPTEELYDTHSDPHEIHNLAGDPRYADVLGRLRKKHLQWVAETRDLGLIPEGELAAREQESGSRMAILQQPGSENLVRRLRDAASASLDGSAAVPRMQAATDDDDAAVRYWGAIGLGNLERLEESLIQSLVKLLRDRSPVVRAAAARALCRHDHAQRGLPVLAEILEQGAQWERLLAINILDELDETALPLLPQMKDALNYRDDFVQRGKYTVRVANRALNELLGTAHVVP